MPPRQLCWQPTEIIEEYVDSVLYSHEPYKIQAPRECLTALPRSLTCSAWFPATRPHLFERIRIRSSLYCTLFTGFVTSCMPKPISFLPFVQEIILQDLPLRDVDTDHTIRAFRGLPNVRTLTLAYWTAVDLPAAFMDALVYCFPNVTCLKLEECDIKDPEQFVQLFCGFPKLSSIHVGDPGLLCRTQTLWIGFDRPAMEPMRALVHPRSLDRRTPLPDLVIDRLDLLMSRQALRLAAVLCQPRFILRLRHLRVNWCCRRISPLFHMLDNVVGSSLEEIALSVDGAGTGDVQKDLRHVIEKLEVTNVRSLTIGQTDLPYNLDPSTLEWVPVLVRHVIRRSRHRVALRIYLRFPWSPDGLYRFPWDELDQLLCALPARYMGMGIDVRIRFWFSHAYWLTDEGASVLSRPDREDSMEYFMTLG
ncbi:hypothetical protein EVJ58_g768 [Rhodofomes roseus]|uniref:F-box domain-containing protein n=1 Tax=Rhodofomes roseus TaxID=34475 RepID=A0A4Y9Z486_9APHY|nr:hypothetical protein EVJ58_g768 [Rhodofomes roseus]